MLAALSIYLLFGFGITSTMFDNIKQFVTIGKLLIGDMITIWWEKIAAQLGWLVTEACQLFGIVF